MPRIFLSTAELSDCEDDYILNLLQKEINSFEKLQVKAINKEFNEANK